MHKHLVETTWNSLIATFGESIDVLPKEGEGYSVEAIFRDESREIGPDFSRSRINTTHPHFKYRPKERLIKVGDKVRIRGKIYRTEESIPDGFGGFVFELERVREKSCN